jgi:hypothetical protein
MLYSCLIIFYWMMLYPGGYFATRDTEQSLVLYLLFVIPASFFSLIIFALYLWIKPLSTREFLIAIYATLVCLIALSRLDFATISTVILFTLTVLSISVCNLHPSRRILNYLFLLSIPTALISYLVGFSIYGIIPGLSGDEELWWRISLFPLVPESGFFSSIIILINLTKRRKSVFNYIMILLGLYFLIFSGIRSALIATFLSFLYHVISTRLAPRSSTRKIILFYLCLLVFIISLLMSTLLTLLPTAGNDFLNVFLFRSTEGLNSETDVAKTVYRTWIWSEHLRIASDNPIIGVGSFDFSNLARNEPIKGLTGSGSEAFLTGLYARVGAPVIFLVAFFGLTIGLRIKQSQAISPMVGIIFFVAMLAYGSFIVPYNFVFLIMVGLISAIDKKSLPYEKLGILLK